MRKHAEMGSGLKEIAAYEKTWRAALFEFQPLYGILHIVPCRFLTLAEPPVTPGDLQLARSFIHIAQSFLYDAPITSLSFYLADHAKREFTLMSADEIVLREAIQTIPCTASINTRTYARTHTPASHGIAPQRETESRV